MSIIDEIVRFVKSLSSLMCESHSILAAVGLTSAPKSDRMRAKLAIRSHIYKHFISIQTHFPQNTIVFHSFSTII
jgi:hypothetical protein